MSEPTWSEAKQIGHLWYKFKQNPDGRWELLSSGDRDSLESNSVVAHDHYWQSNGRWYCQVKVGNRHIMHAEDFMEGIQRQNQIGSLNLTDAEQQELNLTSGVPGQLTSQQVKKLAAYRARQAYGNAGYGGRDRGVEVSPYEAQSFDRLVAQYQSTTRPLNWRDANDTGSVTEASKKALNWRDATPDTNAAPGINPQPPSSRKPRNSTRKNTR
jgi:hypothetical protein